MDFKIMLSMIFGIIITVAGILSMIIFLYLAYKTYQTPIEDKKAKLFGNVNTDSNNKVKKITDLLNRNKTEAKIDLSEFKDLGDDTDVLYIEDETAFLNLEDDTEILPENEYLNDDTELLEDDTELLDDETELLGV